MLSISASNPRELLTLSWLVVGLVPSAVAVLTLQPVASLLSIASSVVSGPSVVVPLSLYFCIGLAPVPLLMN